ncbi:MAG: type VI secretion system ImpA family N-terminal domain-containing protein [Planctomycetes bacterium]|nr:type VI secretion system ImpA family N-terminal domain-containing protein [Planctomycetota bacterium]
MADAALNLGTQPIPGSSPAGAGARYEPEFEQLQAEVAKLENPAGGEVRWGEVLSLGEKLLSQKSKDLLVASYYGFALLQQRGYAGLADAIGMLDAMCRNFWDGLFPELKRLRARESALEWFIDRVNRHLESAPAGGDTAALKTAADRMAALGGFFNSKLEAPNPMFDGLTRSLLARSAGSAVAAPAAAVASAASGGSAPAAVVAGALNNRRAAFEQLRQVAEFLRRTEPHSPVSYLVQRAVKWGDMPLEQVLSELVKNDDTLRNILETLGLKEEKKQDG